MKGMDMSSGNYSFTSRILFFVWIVYWILRFLGYVFSLPLLSHPTLEAAMVGREDGFVDEHCIHVYVGGEVGAVSFGEKRAI